MAFIIHAASLDQGCPHCPIFLTAAFRRSLGRISVPVWLAILSDQLRITDLVGHYPTNYLIRYRLLLQRVSTFLFRAYGVLLTVSHGYPPQKGRFLYITHPFATRINTEASIPVRLACVKRAASVHSEPGSNSQKKDV